MTRIHNALGKPSSIIEPQIYRSAPLLAGNFRGSRILSAIYGLLRQHGARGLADMHVCSEQGFSRVTFLEIRCNVENSHAIGNSLPLWGTCPGWKTARQESFSTNGPKRGGYPKRQTTRLNSPQGSEFGIGGSGSGLLNSSSRSPHTTHLRV